MRNGTARRARKRAPETVDDRQKQTQVRMTDTLKDRIRGYQDKVRADTGIKISFSTAVRVLIEKGLTT